MANGKAVLVDCSLARLVLGTATKNTHLHGLSEVHHNKYGYARGKSARKARAFVSAGAVLGPTLEQSVKQAKKYDLRD